MKRDRLLLLSAFVQFAFFVPLAWWVRKHPHPLREIAISHLVQHKQRSFERSLVLGLNTLTGSAVFLNVLVVPIAAVLWAMRLRLEALMMIATCWTSVLLRSIIKQLVHRPRPNPLLVHATHQPASKSFPSGHVTTSVNFWGWLLAVGLFSRLKGIPGRRALLSLPVVCVAFTGPARVYLGDHWATDVLGGYLFGGGWLCLFLALYLRWREPGDSPGVQRWDEIQMARSHSAHISDQMYQSG